MENKNINKKQESNMSSQYDIKHLKISLGE